MSKILSALGLSSSAALGWYLLALVVAIGAGAAAGGIIVHRQDATACDLRVAALAAVYGQALQDQTDQTLEQERQDRANATRLEEAYVEQSKARETAQAESALLSGELAAARQRLRLLTAPSGGKLPATAVDAGGCDDLRTALDRTLAALALYESEGDQAAGDGQRGVDVATIAAQAARAYGVAGR